MLQTTREKDRKFNRFGFRRCRHDKNTVPNDIFPPDTKNWSNKRICDWKGCKIYIEWFARKIHSNPGIICYIFKEGNYIADYADVYEDVTELIRRSEKYIDYLIEKELI